MIHYRFVLLYYPNAGRHCISLPPIAGFNSNLVVTFVMVLILLTTTTATTTAMMTTMTTTKMKKKKIMIPILYRCHYRCCCCCCFCFCNSEKSFIFSLFVDVHNHSNNLISPDGDTTDAASTCGDFLLLLLLFPSLLFLHRLVFRLY